MFYGDEEIIARRVAAQKRARRMALRETEIEGIVHGFGERAFPPHFAMVLPERLEPLAPEYARLKYPYEDRPGMILSNGDATVNFAFDVMAVEREKTGIRLKRYKTAVKRLHPSFVFISEDVETIVSGLEVACYDYIGSTVDAEVYCLSFFTDLPGGELFGWFNCPAGLREEWGPPVRQMIKTIKPLDIDEADGEPSGAREGSEG